MRNSIQLSCLHSNYEARVSSRLVEVSNTGNRKQLTCENDNLWGLFPGGKVCGDYYLKGDGHVTDEDS